MVIFVFLLCASYIAENSDGGATRSGYIKVTCNSQTGGFTTSGDSAQQSFYQVDVQAPCNNLNPPPAPPAPPQSDYRCIKSMCVNVISGSGVPYNDCLQACGPGLFQCVDAKCVVGPTGLPYNNCTAFCK